MEAFRFAVMGAGRIARKFCEAARLAGAVVVAVAAKDRARADAFALAQGIPAAYGDSEELLQKERVHCVYIATTVNQHAALCRLCLRYRVPILCEKAMFMNGEEAREVLRLAETLGVFCMEATWSRFLPSFRTAEDWLAKGRIGTVRSVYAAIGFPARTDPALRYFNPALGGGAARDITIYAYELTRLLAMPEPETLCGLSVVKSATGVDAAEDILLQAGEKNAVLSTSFLCDYRDTLTVYGTTGRIELPRPHLGGKVILTGANGEEEVFTDTTTQNGFVYEIEETMRCVRAGLPESPAVPHALTLDCARLFDAVDRAMQLQ